MTCFSNAKRRKCIAATTYHNVVNAVKEFASHVVTTIDDMWPNPVGLMAKAMFETSDMQQLQQQLGIPTQEHTGDLLIDYAQKHPR